MAKFAVIARQALIDLLRRAKKGTKLEYPDGYAYRTAGRDVLENYANWKKNISGRTEAMKAYRSKTGSTLPKEKVLIPKGLLDELRQTKSWKQGDEMEFKTPKESTRLSRTRGNSTRDQEV
jgi:hypothetical protein